MTRPTAARTYANFTGGLITEANKLSYPENAVSALVNLNIAQDGGLRRRAGLEYDSGTVRSQVLDGSLNDTAISMFKWESVDGDPDLNIAVIQIGRVLNFYYIKDNQATTLVAAPSITMVPPTRVSASTNTLIAASKVQGVSGGGRFYVAGKYVDPFVISFVKPAQPFDEGTVNNTALILKIRDFEIAEQDTPDIDGYSISGGKRQNFMSGAHFYNLANQGYPCAQESDEVIQEVLTQGGATVSRTSNPGAGVFTNYNAASYTETKLGFFPDITSLFHAYQGGGGTSVEQQLAYSPWALTNSYEGNTPSPRGRLKQEAFYINRQATGVDRSETEDAELLATLDYSDLVASEYRPESIAFYAGRVWFSGLSGGQYTNNVYYSQVIGDDLIKASKCYQQADPTAETINELVATDGGVFNLEEIGKIHRMEPIGPGLAIIAENGVWVIAGEGEFSSFTATNFSIRKITDQGAIGVSSIVTTRDAMYYWSDSAINRLALGQSGTLEAIDVSASTVKTKYLSIPLGSKTESYSVFDEGSDRVYWFYSDGTAATFTDKTYNKVLYIDAALGAFGEYNIAVSEDNLPLAAISARSSSQRVRVENVVDLDDPVEDLGDQVVDTTSILRADVSTVKILTASITGSTLNYRLSEFSNVDDFSDWGTDSPAYMESGFDSLGDVISGAKMAPVLQVHLERTEDGFEAEGEEYVLTKRSGCLLSHKWDWGDRFSVGTQVYKLLKPYVPSGAGDTFEYDRSVITTRNRLRGRGMSLGIRVDSEAEKDMRLLGYGILFSGRSRA